VPETKTRGWFMWEEIGMTDPNPAVRTFPEVLIQDVQDPGAVPIFVVEEGGLAVTAGPGFTTQATTAAHARKVCASEVTFSRPLSDGLLLLLNDLEDAVKVVVDAYFAERARVPLQVVVAVRMPPTIFDWETLSMHAGILAADFAAPQTGTPWREMTGVWWDLYSKRMRDQ